MRAFRVGKKRVIKEGVIYEVDEDNENEDSLNLDESVDLDNRISSDKVIKIIRDFIIKENTTIKAALHIDSISSDVLVDKDKLKSNIKFICKN